ncbi:MAG: helix-turn-helix domain-containing protein [Actinomycetota bacterium]|nr:helix-turn-helix domain-containing protein [Actinomycetota bacterium]
MAKKRHTGVEPIVESFLARMDEVVERSAGAIRDAVPSYSRSVEVMRDVRDAVRENVSTLGRVLAEGREVKRDELEGIERVGARRAEAGVPLDDVLHAYRTVSRVCWDILAEECRGYRGDALEPTIELAEAVLRYTDDISTSVAEAYARAQRSIVREQEGARREFLADLLYGTDVDPEDVLRRAHAFGYDLSLSYVAMVGVGPEAEARKEAAVAAAASKTTAQAAADAIVLQKGQQTIALLPSDPFADPVVVPEKLAIELGDGWKFGVGGPEPGLEGIRRAYIEAREALEIGSALALSRPVFRFDDVLLYHFLRIEPGLVERFVELTIGPLIDYDDRRKGELVKTLDAYFSSDGSIKLAGEKLFAHPHTVTYRLKQVERLTAWSLRDPEDKLRLQLALRAYKLGQSRRDAEESPEPAK